MRGEGLARLPVLLLTLAVVAGACSEGKQGNDTGAPLELEDSDHAASDGSADSLEETEAPEDAVTTDDANPAEDLESDAADAPTTAPTPDPMEAGPFAWSEVASEILVDELGTMLPLDIAIPDGPGPFPVVIFTHGFALNASYYQTYKTHLASWGYIAILPSMPGTAFNPKTHEEMASYLLYVVNWVGQTGADPLGDLMGRADATRIGLSGHSMGGKLSLLTASMDSRIDASFTVDPVDSSAPVGDQTGYPSVTPERMDSIAIPLAFAGETPDGTPVEGSSLACAPKEQNFEQYFLYASSSSPAYKIDFLGASHMSFLDNADCGFACILCKTPTADPESVRKHTLRYMIAFYNMYLYQLPEYSYWLVGGGMQSDVDSGLVTVESKGL